MASLAASRGFTGALDILEGDVGFGAAMSTAPDWEPAMAALGAPWTVCGMTVKTHSCCGHTFAAVDAALELRAEGVRAQDIESVEVETYTVATKVAGYADPQTEFEAKFSVRYAVAAAFQLGSVRLMAFTPEQVTSPVLRGIMERTDVRATEEFDSVFPGQRGARVFVRLVDGSTRTRLRTTRKGDPDDPLTDSDLSGKFDDLAVPIIGVERSLALREMLWSMLSVPDVASAPGL
jgi:2-methylcitrate dehydratase PrpD